MGLLDQLERPGYLVLAVPRVVPECLVKLEQPEVQVLLEPKAPVEHLVLRAASVLQDQLAQLVQMAILVLPGLQDPVVQPVPVVLLDRLVQADQRVQQD